jgi:phosphoglycerol transferase MdoB-like AlkP superfamily enzyme
MNATFCCLALVAIAAVLTFAVEAVLRGSISDAAAFLIDPSRPGWATIGILFLVLLAGDAFARKALQSAIVVVPLAMTLAWVGHEKRFYLGDPPYPTDFLYARQIVELLPLMLVERPLAAVAICLGLAAGIALLILAIRRSAKLPRVTVAGRVARLAIALPAIALIASQMDYASHSPLRARLNIEPMMWDQKANYAHNGLLMAFALNVPMANVAAPSGYGGATLARISAGAQPPFVPATKPDIIMVMSESLWDPLRLPGVSIAPDPLADLRRVQSGNVFSPEFGGMTANVEFEALTGFSNAMLPYGSIPYQQYIRRDMPSLASFLGANGYKTVAMHPFQGWFWNRSNVYEHFGFDRFLDEDDLKDLPKRGRLAGDEAFTDAIIEQAEAARAPLFLFAVTLQNHGPYEKDRYPDRTLDVETTAGPATGDAIHTFAEGMADANDGLMTLIEWAGQRERETIVVFFGDHLPPLGPTYVKTGFLDRNVGDRVGPAERLAPQRETPLVVWSNRNGPVPALGTVSPSFLPLHTLRAAGIEHPFYTGFLGELHQSFDVIDRHLLIGRDGTSVEGWSRQRHVDAGITDYRLVQHDAMFGDRHALDSLFPGAPQPLIAEPKQIGEAEASPL